MKKEGTTTSVGNRYLVFYNPVVIPQESSRAYWELDRNRDLHHTDRAPCSQAHNLNKTLNKALNPQSDTRTHLPCCIDHHTRSG